MVCCCCGGCCWFWCVCCGCYSEEEHEFACEYKDCGFRFETREELLQHQIDAHGVEVELGQVEPLPKADEVAVDQLAGVVPGAGASPPHPLPAARIKPPPDRDDVIGPRRLLFGEAPSVPVAPIEKKDSEIGKQDPVTPPPVPPKRSMEEANVPVMPAPKPEDSPPSPPDGHGNVQIVRTHSAIGAIEDEDYDNMEGDEL